MSEMVERIARAIVQSLFDDCPDADWRGCEITACAVVEAMREPTAAMKLAGAAEHFGYDIDVSDKLYGSGVIWKAMIDEALK